MSTVWLIRDIESYIRLNIKRAIRISMNLICLNLYTAIGFAKIKEIDVMSLVGTDSKEAIFPRPSAGAGVDREGRDLATLPSLPRKRGRSKIGVSRTSPIPSSPSTDIGQSSSLDISFTVFDTTSVFMNKCISYYSI